jgi:hypothetical protein
MAHHSSEKADKWKSITITYLHLTMTAGVSIKSYNNMDLPRAGWTRWRETGTSLGLQKGLLILS